ncbi:hypothetical protein [Marinospirillum insulare]|uniref:Uncharacterized protein n=1 Tax=Marinospirillum insulare TaxID=217169 RepID=A0ABQ5ZVZ8_9GAMM|nr:hypothetical protein [Marinospirillum insulare]GLR63602.1 hypothetical protein GCM10007878_10370 [Marinospirillum insulare]
MSNSSLKAEKVIIEVVRPDDGRLESVWVTLFILGVLLLGALGIWARQTPALQDNPSASLNTLERQLLLELSIAADEIEFMQSFLDGESLTLESLTEQALLPVFAGQTLQAWQAIDQNCFFLLQPKTTAAFALSLPRNAPARIFFTPELIEFPDTCNQLSSWLRMDNLP